MAAVDGGGFKLEEDIGAKISGFRKDYDNDRDGREDYGKYMVCVSLIHNFGHTCISLEVYVVFRYI